MLHWLCVLGEWILVLHKFEDQIDRVEHQGHVQLCAWFHFNLFTWVVAVKMPSLETKGLIPGLDSE